MNINYYSSVGFAVEMLAKSPYHQGFKVGDYLAIEVLPALWANQVRFYLTDEGIPTGMLTWALLSDEMEAELLETGRALNHDEWQSGKRVFINDLIAPYDNSKAIILDLVNNVFADHHVTSVRRDGEDKIRKVNRWVGTNLRGQKSQH